MVATLALRREGIPGIAKYSLAHLGMNSAQFSMAHDFNGPTFDLGAACAGSSSCRLLAPLTQPGDI
jgi:hypothetical protein